MISPLWFAAFFGISEIVVSTILRSKSESKASDKGSLRMLWLTINACMIGAIALYLRYPAAAFGTADSLVIGIAVFLCGIGLRWYAIIYLGKFFTVDVTVTADQTVIDSGPYRLIRHPSYTGVLLAFSGIGVAFGNYASLFLLTLPILAAFLIRIRVEEAALLNGLGDPYRSYMKNTRRLIPYVF